MYEEHDHIEPVKNKDLQANYRRAKTNLKRDTSCLTTKFAGIILPPIKSTRKPGK